MSGPGFEAKRALRIGIDGREMEGRPTGVGRYLRSLLTRWDRTLPHSLIVYSGAPVELALGGDLVANRVLGDAHSLWWEQRTLPAAARADGIDVLFCPAYSCPLLASMPRVTAIHDLSFFARREEFTLVHGLRRRMMARLAARLSRSLLACSEFTKSEIRRHLGPVAAAKTAVVALGPDDGLPPGPDRAACRAALGLSDADTYVITVGTILARRNIPMLVRAVSRLVPDHPGLRLGIVGDNRSHPFEDPMALARSLGCERAVRVSGFVANREIAGHYAAADLAIFLSEYEGFGLPALEAMSRGVPTMVADRASLNEIFGPGALVVEPNEAGVVGGLTRVIGDPAFAADLRRRGQEHAKAFSWERAAADTLRVLEGAAL